MSSGFMLHTHTLKWSSTTSSPSMSSKCQTSKEINFRCRVITAWHANTHTLSGSPLWLCPITALVHLSRSFRKGHPPRCVCGCSLQPLRPQFQLQSSVVIPLNLPESQKQTLTGWHSANAVHTHTHLHSHLHTRSEEDTLTLSHIQYVRLCLSGQRINMEPETILDPKSLSITPSVVVQHLFSCSNHLVIFILL